MPRLLLIVDDSPQMAANLEIALWSVPGVEVAIASSGDEALRVIESRGGVAAVITDLEMPRMNGFELIERLRADPRYSRIPIIVASGSCDPGVPERVCRLGANAYFVKPYSPAELRSRLEQLRHETQEPY
jgi:CheY-like chemotaxis protein